MNMSFCRIEQQRRCTTCSHIAPNCTQPINWLLPSHHALCRELFRPHSVFTLLCHILNSVHYWWSFNDAAQAADVTVICGLLLRVPVRISTTSCQEMFLSSSHVFLLIERYSLSLCNTYTCYSIIKQEILETSHHVCLLMLTSIAYMETIMPLTDSSLHNFC
jgi:hypothetical protein